MKVVQMWPRELSVERYTRQGLQNKIRGQLETGNICKGWRQPPGAQVWAVKLQGKDTLHYNSVLLLCIEQFLC